MRRLGLWGLGLVLLLAPIAAAVRAGDDTGDDAKQAAPAIPDTGQRVWSSHLFHHTTPRPPRKPPKKKDKPAAEKPAPKPAVAPQDEPAAVRAREEAAYLRRLEVCLKLKEIAEEKGDAALARMADDLDARARAVYFQRIADLPASRAEPEQDERLPGKHAAAQGAGTALPAPLPHTVPGEEAAAGPAAPGEE